MMQNGRPSPTGAVYDGEGVNFALFSSGAEAVELCLYDSERREIQRLHLPDQSDGVWHGYLPACRPGQRYGYRVHGPWAPWDGLRYNPAKLLLDPHARRLDGVFRWTPAAFDFDPQSTPSDWRRSESDNAAYMPLCVVTPDRMEAIQRPNPGRQRIPWTETVIYEANLRGFTMRHPEVPEIQRGTFRGMSNSTILDYLKALGITSLELMPLHAFIDEQFLVKRGLRNFWGYNSIQFFVPDARFGCADPVAEFREMVDAIHDAGIEVILDVVYNHTGESDEFGPMLSFRGIDNLAYYRTEPGEPGRYVNDTGCGNCLNADHPRVQDLVIDSLLYWHREMGVDGFRFDLAPVLGRKSEGFDPAHPLLSKIAAEPGLRGVKRIAEPWDAGPGGYQLGQFPPSWGEWNDRYRDTVRRFWRGDGGQPGKLARCLHGSADIFDARQRAPQCSINFITSHDGFTLQDLVSYERRHNEANGQDNRDGQRHNFSRNHGVEGPSYDEEVNRARQRHKLNLMATLLLSQGTPMLTAGDEFGNSQNGNNNAYAQDNPTGWLDWCLLDSNRSFFDKVRELLLLRKECPLLRQPVYLHGRTRSDGGWSDIRWLRADGAMMKPADWDRSRSMTLQLTRHPSRLQDSPTITAAAIMVNGSGDDMSFRLPADAARWTLRFFSSEQRPSSGGDESWILPGLSIVFATGRAVKKTPLR